MADDTSAALIAQLDVKFDTLATNMKKAMTVFDNGGRQLEKRQAQIKKNLSDWTLDFTGLSGLNKALVGLTAAGIIGGLGDLVKKGIDAAASIGDVAKQAGVGVERLQELRFAAAQSGASFDILDQGLTTLNRNFGEFVNTGAGRAAAAFKQLGIDKLINTGQVRDTEEAFDAIVKKLQGVGSEAQKSSLAAKLFGQEAGPQLLQTLEQGTEGIARLTAEAQSLGIVLTDQTVLGAKEANDKLGALFQVMKAEGISAVAQLAPEIAELSEQIIKGLPDLITWVEKWADFFGLIKLSDTEKLKIDLADANKELAKFQALKDAPGLKGFLFRPFNIDSLISDAKAKVQKLQEELSIQPVTITGPPKARPAPLTVPQTDAEIAKAKALAEKRAELLRQTGVDAATADAALVVAQDQTNVQLLKGSTSYYDAVKKQIDDEYNAKVAAASGAADKQYAALAKDGTNWKGYAQGVANVSDELTAKIVAAAEERKQALDAASPTGESFREAIAAGEQQVQNLQDQAAAEYLIGSQLARVLFLEQALAEARAKDPGFKGFSADQAKQLQAQADAIANATTNPTDSYEKQQADAYARIDELRQQDLISEKEAAAEKLQIDQKLSDARLQNASDMFSGLASLAQSSNSTLAAIGKAAAIAQATIDGYLAIQKALASAPPPFNYALAAGVAVQTAANIARIAGVGFESGGYTGDGARNQPAGTVHKGEYVFDQGAVKRIGVANLQRLQKGYADGGYVGFAMPAAPSVGRPANSNAPGVMPPILVQPKIGIYNIDDPRRLGDYLETNDGQKRIINVLRINGIIPG